MANTPAPQPLDERTSASIVIQLRTEGFTAVSLADALGEFDKENLDVAINYVLLPQEILLAMSQGDVDAAAMGVGAGFYNAVGSSDEFRIVMSASEPAEGTAGIFVRTDHIAEDGHFDACSFKGMNVALGPQQRGSIPAYWLGRYLAEHCPSLTVADVNAQPLAGPDALVALQSGAVDAAILQDLLSEEAIASGAGSLVVPNLPGGAGLVMGRLRTEHPEVAEAIVRAVLRTQRTYLQGDYHADPDVLAALSTVLEVPQETITAGKSLTFSPDGTYPEDAVPAMQEYFLSVDPPVLTYSEPIAASQIIDSTLAAAALDDA